MALTSFTTFTKLMSLKKHGSIHTGRKDFKCDLCNKAFRENIGLSTHKKYYCKDSVKSLSCEHCPKTFSFHGDLNRHYITHSGVKAFQCDICDQTFSRAGNLRSHINSTHFFEKPFECDICDTKFTRSNHIKDHKMMHTDERPYDCELCGKSFRRKRDLALHTGSFHEAKKDIKQETVKEEID